MAAGPGVRASPRHHLLWVLPQGSLVTSSPAPIPAHGLATTRLRMPPVLVPWPTMEILGMGMETGPWAMAWGGPSS